MLSFVLRGFGCHTISFRSGYRVVLVELDRRHCCKEVFIYLFARKGKEV